MNILLTNDDGVSSSGFSILSKLCKKVDPNCNVQIVAPKKDKSGVGQSISLNQPLKLERLNQSTFSIDGTPSDCVITAINKLVPDIVKPDIVISGINIGMNIGIDTLYSGTIAAAVQANIFGIKSFAISQFYKYKDKFFFNTDNAIFFKLFRKIITLDNIFGKCIISINLPCVEIKGIKCIQYDNSCTHNIVEKYDDDCVIIKMNGYSNIPYALEEGYILVTLVRCYREETNNDIYNKLQHVINDL